MQENLAREELLDDLMGSLDDQRFSDAVHDRAAIVAQRRYIAPDGPMPRPILYQPASGLTILRGGETWWGSYHCDGIYIADHELCKRAQRNSIERDHLEALRRNDWLDRQRVRFELTERGRGVLAAADESGRRIAS